MDLKDAMEMDTVILVREDGTFREAPGVYGPEIELSATWDEHGDAHISPEDDEEMIRHAKSQGWDILTGWTSQYGYSGPLMHSSEYIGGKLAEHILETPGLWVALPAEIMPPGKDESESAGWVLAFRDTTCVTDGCENQATPGDHEGMCLKCNPFGGSMVMNNDPEYQRWLNRPSDEY
ncbi:hypothetical protein [Rhodococcus qingshengii]|uniref:hypothetical protein n=1 Tax=Rhodococcus qingshengii TaxID=334542 RepID=UPI0035E2AD67